MSFRRNRAKADATRTPLADLAPTLPVRTDAERVDERDMPLPEPDDDMLPESSATMPATPPETDTAPANVRSRPGARKITDRAATPAIPRTIAEMQAGVTRTNTVETDAIEAEERIAAEPLPLFINARTLVLTTYAPYVILALVPALLFYAFRAAHFSDTVSFVAYFVALAACSIIALLLLFRNWRIAFHAPPDELRPSSLLLLWEQRSRGERPDAWKTGGVAIVGVFLLLFLLNMIAVLFNAGVAATYLVPFQLVLLATRIIGAFLFYGYLQRGLASLMTETRAAIVTGFALGISAALVSVVTYAALVSNSTPSSQSSIFSFAAITMIVALIGAWIRMRTAAVYPAVAFYLLLLGFSPY
ncbi:MAG: hypothetical protein M3176_03390 [Chloroflexota bacterium]|nr:hypothetical protein [Chloroflexota bacterium]